MKATALLLLAAVDVSANCIPKRRIADNTEGVCTYAECAEGDKGFLGGDLAKPCRYICGEAPESCCSYAVGGNCATTRGATTLDCLTDADCTDSENGGTCCNWQNENGVFTRGPTGTCGSSCMGKMDKCIGGKDSMMQCTGTMSCCAWGNDAGKPSTEGFCGDLGSKRQKCELSVSIGQQSGDVCDKTLLCGSGLTCCNWDNSNGGSTMDKGTCGEMCAMNVNIGQQMGDECDTTLLCGSGLTCCNWDNSNGGSTMDKGNCGEVCIQTVIAHDDCRDCSGAEINTKGRNLLFAPTPDLPCCSLAF